MIDLIGLPPRYQYKTLDNYDATGQEEKVALAVKAIDEGRSLYLTGVPGCGKTHLAAALLLRKHDAYCASIANDGRNPWERLDPVFTFLPSVELFLQLKSSFGNPDVSEDDVLSRYVKCVGSLLVLDDIGAEKVSDWSRQMFYTLLDRLYRYECQVIVTSNLSLGQLGSYMDDRVASRLVEMGEVITLDPVDHRVKKAKGVIG